jgi:phage baseplate assembly protein gpV
MDILEDLYDHIKQLHSMVSEANSVNADLARRLDTMFRPGKVTDVDTKKQLYRQEIAEQDGKPQKSPWIPYGQMAGDYKSHTPPVVGQQMWMISPNGDGRQAMGLPLTFSDKNKSPGDKEDHVHTFGEKYRIREQKDKLREITIDKVKVSHGTGSITTSINGGNTPKDSNGPKADDSSENNQEASGSSIKQEEKAVTIKTPGVTVTQGEKEYTIAASDKITFEVGASSVTITAADIAAISDLIYTKGNTRLGSKEATAKVMLETGPATKVRGV